MAHRGRLNVLAHIVGLPYETIFAEFEGGRHVEETLTPEGGTGDVKYHHGADGVYQTAAGKPVNITLSPNPSHLEAVNPVVEGRARANQTNRRGKDAIHDGSVALPVLIHGDASFAAQGVVAETFNLARLKAYTQPVMYERIKQTPTVRQRYADQLAREGVVDAAAAAAEAEQKYQRLTDVQQSLKANLREAGAGEEPQRISGAYSPTLEPETAGSTPLLTTLNEQLLQAPEGLTVIPKLNKQPERRRAGLTGG